MAVEVRILPPPLDWIAVNGGRWAYHWRNEYCCPGDVRVVEVS
jgi:hypothetical protein